METVLLVCITFALIYNILMHNLPLCLLEESNILSVSADKRTKLLSGVQSPADVQAVRVYLIIIYSSTFRERKRKTGEIYWGV